MMFSSQHHIDPWWKKLLVLLALADTGPKENLPLITIQGN